MLKRCLCLVFVVMLTMSIATPKAEAGWGDVGGILDYIRKMYGSMEEMRNSMGGTFNGGLSTANSNQIEVTLAEIIAMNAAIERTTLDNEWKENGVYNIGNDDLKSVYASASKMDMINTYTIETIRQAKEAQGLVNHIDAANGDGNILIALMSGSRDTTGVLAATQAGNQINALQAAQMMRLQQVLALNNNLQAAQQAQQALKDQMAMKALRNYYKGVTSISTETKDTMRGSLNGLTD